jgi:hypothetical protein
MQACVSVLPTPKIQQKRPWFYLLFLPLLWLLHGPGCASAPPTRPIDLSAPGWTVRQAQAVWQPSSDKPEITGDVVLSTHPSGAAYLQFSKALPIATARHDADSWEIEFPPENKRFSGRGEPPRRFVWLQLLRALDGERISDRWQLSHPSEMFIALEDEHTGERLQVHFAPGSK